MAEKKRGPKPNHLHFDDEDWENAVKKAVRKGKSKKGFPKVQKPRKSD